MITATASAQILQRISSLPPLPAAIGRLLRLVNEPDVDFKEIAKTISLDQTMTAQLLRIANSAFYGFPQQIRTVQQATVILGRYAVRNMALSLAMVKVRGHMKADGPLTPEEFWRHSMAVACGARMLAQHQRSVAADEAFVAGLLHDIGKIVFVEYDSETYADLLQKAQDGIGPLHILEHETFGIDHAEVGEALCAHWNIPDVLASVVSAHHGNEAGADETALEIVDIVNVADTLAKVGRIGNGGSPHVPAKWLTGSRAFADRSDRVRQTLNSLGEEVAVNEQIFFNRPSVGSYTDGLGARTHAVHVSITDPDLRTLVEFAARAHDCGVVPIETEHVDLVIADESFDGSARADAEAREVPVADFTYWQGEQISRDWINLHKLHTWLTESLAVPVPAS